MFFLNIQVFLSQQESNDFHESPSQKIKTYLPLLSSLSKTRKEDKTFFFKNSEVTNQKSCLTTLYFFKQAKKNFTLIVILLY